MRGQVELYTDYGTSKEEMIYVDHNVLVDAGGQLLADIMTYPSPSLSGIAGLSSILDASNYTIQALSFGKASKNFSKHAHTYPSSLSNSSTVITWASGGPRAIVLPFDASGQDHYPTSAYPGGPYLPSYTDPHDIILEKNSIPIVAQSLSSTFVTLGDDVGQNLNMIPYRDELVVSSLAPYQKTFEASGWPSSGTDGFFGVSPLGGSSIWLGCFPDSSADGGTSAYLVSSWDGITDSVTTTATITRLFIRCQAPLEVFLGTSL